MAKTTRETDPSPLKQEKKPHPARPLDPSEAERRTGTQTFRRYAENRSTKRPRKWLITYQLVEGPAIQPKKNRPSRWAEPAPESEQPSRSAQGELFETASAPPKKGGKRKAKPRA